MSGFANNAANIGKALTRAVTLPVLAIGGASLFMASQFESAIGRIAGLAPITEQVGGGIGEIRQRLLDLAQVVPTAPNELADSLYYAGSAGLDAEEAFQVVELSAKGAAIGMGEAADISRVLIAALNNFGAPAGGPLTAAKAMDALTAAIKVGSAEPEEMAIALGRVLPVAKAAGVTFEETVGSLAALTNIGLPARVATTSLRALFAELLAPTQQASARLDTLGLSAQKVRDVLATFGPVGAFELLSDAVDGDADALRDVLPQIRGFTAYLGLAEDRLAESKQAMDATVNSTGALQKAFDIISKTPAFRFEIGLNKLRVAAIDLGSTLFPVLDKIIQVMSDVGDALANLPGPVQKAAIAFGLLAAAVGPVLQLLGNMGALIAGPITTLKQFSVSAIAAGIAVITLVASFQSLASGSKSLYSVLVTVVAGATAVFTAMRLIQGAAQAGLLGVNALSLGLVSMSTGGLALAAVGVGVLVAAIGLLLGSANRTQKAVDQMGEAFTSAAQSSSLFRIAIRDIEDEELAQRFTNIAKSLGLFNKALTTDTLGEFTQGIGSQLVGALTNLDNIVQANEGVLGRIVTAEDIATLSQARDVIAQTVAAGGDLGANLKRAGIDSAEFFGLLDQLDIAPIEGLGEAAGNVDELARAYGEAQGVLKDFEAQTQATITVRAADAAATERYAAQLGVSTEFLQGRLDAVGVSAIGMDETAKSSFEDLVFVSDDSGQRIAANVAEMQAQIDEATSNISDSIAGAFAGFEKAESDLKGTTESLLGNFITNSRAIVQMTGNLNDLAQAGLPAGLLDQLAAGGPEMVEKFVNATPAQLKRLTAAYESELEAVDSAILTEANLQGEKGKSMVGKFTAGILSNSQLPPQAASRIVNEMVAKFSSGNVSAAGLQQALNFARGLGTVKNLTQQEAGKAMDAFIAGIGKRNLLSLGERQVREFANGIAKSSGISKVAAQRLVQRTIDSLKPEEKATTAGGDTANQYAAGLRGKQQEASGAGQQVGSSAVGGLKGSVGGAASTGSAVGNAYVSSLMARKESAYNAGFAVGKAGVDGMKDGAKGSPKYGSYYLGIDLIDQLAEGMEKGKVAHGFSSGIGFRFPVTLSQGRVADEGGRRRFDRKRDLDLDVTIDRTRTAKALDWEYAVRGR